MKIAIATTSFLPNVGGAELVMHHLAQQWCRMGHEVCVINSTTDQATHPEALYCARQFKMLRGSSRFSYHRFPFGGYATRAMQRALRAYRPDFISGHFGYPVGVWLGWMKNLPPYLVTDHGPAVCTFSWGGRARYNFDDIIGECLNRATGVVAISTWARQQLQDLRVRPDKIVDIPNGADLERFGRRVDLNIRSKFNLPADSLLVLSVGRDHAQKAFDVGIKAFAQASIGIPEARYLILGRQTTRWQSLVDDLGCSGRVILCDGLYGDELVAAYQQADVFLSSSIFELCPLVVVEAMAGGCPAVVTNVSGSQDMIHTGENGIVVEPGDIPAMANALRQLLEQPELREQYSQAARQKSLQFGWDNIARQYLDAVGLL